MALPTEFKLIDIIIKKAKSYDALSDCYISVGDDCAAFEPKRKFVVLSTDAAVETVHFDFNIMSARAAGYRALAANVSDISAMGSDFCCRSF